MTDTQSSNTAEATLRLVLDRTSMGSSTGSSDAPGLGMSAWTDWFGVVASIACAIHCAAMPFVIAFLPAMGLTFLGDAFFHKVMVVVCSLLAIAAFVPGWRRHRRVLPGGVAAVGLALITTAAFALECGGCPTMTLASESSSPATVDEESHCALCVEAGVGSDATLASDGATPWVLSSLIPFVTPLGGLLLVSAHLANRRYSCRCGCCPK